MVHDEMIDRPSTSPIVSTQRHVNVCTQPQLDTNGSSEWTSPNTQYFRPNSFHQSTSPSHDQLIPQPELLSQQGIAQQEDSTGLSQTYVLNHQFLTSDASNVPGDYNLFFDNYDISNFYLPAAVYDSELPISLWSRPDADPLPVEHQPMFEYRSALENRNGPSNQGESPSPPSGLGGESLIDSRPQPRADRLRDGPPWKVSGQDYRNIQIKMNDFTDILPEGFNLPTRHALSRYFEGYITGFNQHLPFLHIPSFSVPKFVPELILAIAAVGAQYRFESARGNKLWYAAKAIAAEQIRKRQRKQVADILTSPPSRNASINTSPAFNTTPPGTAVGEFHHVFTSTERNPQDEIGWGPPPLLREATSMQNHLALLIRDHSLQTVKPTESELRWEDWVFYESECRTKCIAYCWFNLHSIAYDNPPVLRTSELKVDLPHSTEEWRAKSSEEWYSMRTTSPQVTLSLHDALSRLFLTDQEELSTISSLGNYVLIHAIIQQIYVVRQASTLASPITANGSLQPGEVSKFGQVLHIWQIGWEKAPESSMNPMNPYGPVAFSSTALLRLAYIRLHCDLGPCRGLDSRDPQIIARTLKACPPLTRSPLMSRAILQAAHALSIPVKIGIKYVAHTHTLLWSMQHSLVNLECAFLLSRWLYMISGLMDELTVDESNLLEMVRSIVGETHFADEPKDGATLQGSKGVRSLSIAVVKIWAEVFTGSHHVFPLVKVIGLALTCYASMCEAEEEVDVEA
ncbi:hypothetical protein VTL71DRAFT_5869 [Oculimacula yallundae]|uniref:Transcription factor domain-containing protein n=1 Tax=Oculimacula yallundae TaxID=86028 RepID=A0ABR4BYU8_9HELO